MCLICLEMDGWGKQPLLWRTTASHKIHASEYETIHCKYSHSNRQIRQQVLALLKATARMPESILFDKKDKIISSHHDKSLRSFRCASYALKWMGEVNDHYFGRPKYLTNYVQVNMIPLQVFTLQLANKTIYHGDIFLATWQKKFTNSKSKILNFPRYGHICLRVPGNHDTTTLQAYISV